MLISHVIVALCLGVVNSLAQYQTNISVINNYYYHNQTKKSSITNYLEETLCNLYTPIIYVYYADNLITSLADDLVIKLNYCKVAPLLLIK
jgi:hypothetical protein